MTQAIKKAAHLELNEPFVWEKWLASFVDVSTDSPETAPRPPLYPEIAEARALCGSGDTTKALKSINDLLLHFPVGQLFGCLVEAIAAGDVEIVRLLLSKGLSPQRLGYSAFSAIEKGYLDILVLLRDHGWDINYVGSGGHYINSHPLMAAVRVRERPVNPVVVQWLLENGANPDIRGATDETPLYSAVIFAPFEVVKAMVDAIPGGRPRHGDLLHAAAQREPIGECGKVIDLVLQRTDCSADDTWFSRDPFSAITFKSTGLGTPLHIAARANGNVESAAALLARGASITKHDGLGHTPFDTARICKNEEVLQLLLRAQEDTEAERSKI